MIEHQDVINLRPFWDTQTEKLTNCTSEINKNQKHMGDDVYLNQISKLTN